MVSFNVFGGVSVQVVEDELVGVHCSHQRVCRLQETEEVVELKVQGIGFVPSLNVHLNPDSSQDFKL